MLKILKSLIPVWAILCLIFGSFSFAKEIKEEAMIPKMGEKEEVAPEFKFLYPKSGAEVKEEIQIKGKVKEANSVEFYCQLPNAPLPVYLGKAFSKGENIWEYSWNTNLTPNGTYQLVAKITNQYGEYEGQKINIEIKNEIKREKEKEENLKKDIEKTEKEIEKEDGEVTKKKEETKEEITQKIQESVDEAKEVLEEKEKKIVESEIEKKIEETKEIVKEQTEKLIERGKEAKKIEEGIKKKEIEKGEIEKQIKMSQEELKKALEEKEKLMEGLRKEEVKKIEEIKKERLEGQKIEKEKIEKETTVLKENLENVEKEKADVKKQIIEKVNEIIKPIEKLSPEEKMPEISEVKKEIEEKVISSLEGLEKKVEEKEKIKTEKTQVLIKDSDRDGLSDEEEIRLETNPFNPDSDSDGFLDKEEYLAGYDPLKPGPADKIVYQDPKKVKPQKTDIYTIERVEMVDLPTGQKGLKLEGKGLPNSFVTVYIFSYAIVMTTKTDGNGNWSLILDKPLVDGQHEAYVSVTNNHGEITANSEPFLFVKSGEKVSAIILGAVPAEKVVSPAEVLQRSFLILIIGVITFSLGIALIIIGILTQKKERKVNSI